jgi:hypothetical protein
VHGLRVQQNLACDNHFYAYNKTSCNYRRFLFYVMKT